jgi:hypothetical protein
MQLIERGFAGASCTGLPHIGGRSYVRARYIADVVTQLGRGAQNRQPGDRLTSGSPHTVGPVGSTAKWFYFATPDGAFVGDDGVTSTAHAALRVVPRALNPTTHRPAYSKTVPQEQNSALPGGLDHVKWLVYMNHLSSSGFPGFDAPPGQKLVCQTTLGGSTLGTTDHPFGDAVTSAEDDLRLASFALTAIDFQTYMVFDVFYTNRRIYALYEHLPFGRQSMGGPYDEYAAFTYAIPIANRSPGDVHSVATVYDRSAGVVSWTVDGDERFRVNNLGFRIGRTNMLLDHGGTEASFQPTQLDCGLGMFTLLDGHGPHNKSLVKLSSTSNFYFNPILGAPTPEVFVDPDSRPKSRLFGQGAVLLARRPAVGTVPGH